MSVFTRIGNLFERWTDFAISLVNDRSLVPGRRRSRMRLAALNFAVLALSVYLLRLVLIALLYPFIGLAWLIITLRKTFRKTFRRK